MSDLNVSLLVRLLDQFSGPSGKVLDSLRRMKSGAGDFRRAFSAEIKRGFSAENIEKALKENERKVSEARGRLVGAFGMALSLGAPVMAAGNIEEKLIDFGKLADLDREKLKALSAELDMLSRRDRTGLSQGALLAGLETYVGKGLDLERALAALPATGRAAKATGAEFDEMAAAGFAAMDNLKVAPEELRKAFDIMAASGKEGSFELKDMARNFPELTASAQALGMRGTQGVSSLSAALQIAMKAAGSADQAANNTSNFLGKLTSPDAVKKFADFGVDVQKELEAATARGADPLEHMLETIERVTGGDQFKMGQLFADKQVLDFLRAVIPNMEEYRRIKAASAGADGIIDKDYDKQMAGFNESLRQLRQSLTGLFGASGVLLPIFTDLINKTTGVVDSIRDWTVANPELTAFLVKGAAAALAFGISARMLGYAFAVGRGNLIRFLSLFLKFSAEGRNISIMARALRGLGAGFSWARIIPRLAWRSVLPALRWATFVPKLAWSSIIGILNWASFIPRKLFLRDFGPGVTQIGPAMERAATRTEAASQRISRSMATLNNARRGLNWRAAMGGAGLLMWGLPEINAQTEETRARWEASGAIPTRAQASEDRRNAAAQREARLQEQMRAVGNELLFEPPAALGGRGAATADAAPVKVEETINHDYKSDTAITVTVPVQITQQISRDMDKIARDTGAQTERALRKALADTEVPQ